MKNLTKLAIPLLLMNLLNLTFSFIDTITISQFDIKGVSAISVATAPINIMVQLIGVMIIGLQIMGSAAVCEKSSKRLTNIYKVSFIQMLIVTVLMITTGLMFTKEIVNFYGTNDVLSDAKIFYTIRLFSLIFLPYIYLIKTSFEINKSTSIALYLIIVTGCTNFGIDLLLIYGFGLGVLGSAIGTFTSIVAGLIFLVYKNQKIKQINLLDLFDLSTVDKELHYSMFKINAFEATNIFFDYFGISLINVFVAQTGSLGLATNKILTLFFSLAFGLSQSIAYSYLIYMGNSDANEKQVLIKAYFLSLLTLTPLIVTLFFFPTVSLSLFSSSPIFLKESLTPLKFQSLLFIVLPLVTLTTSKLRRMNKVVHNTVISIVATWCVRIPLAYYFLTVSSKGVLSVVISTAGYIFLRIILNFIVISRSQT
ncbi:MATE family efflux transporter [Streptococcus suis]|uniref:MATE family efflux transporter n=1 Tax=Streptococcus suis TaxID=1307 RepID=UPI00209AECAB|nr:MATE family efflux transporter [Streptococcus suis]MCO8214239.1 MATE family efflux transporter [Streptococcus suis]HEM3439608.1 MATE family efflux transporter [Streptococcus suis]